MKKFSKITESLKSEQDRHIINDIVGSLNMCKSIESVKVVGVSTPDYDYIMSHKNKIENFDFHIIIKFTKMCLHNKKIDVYPLNKDFAFTQEEISDYWLDLIDVMSQLKGAGFVAVISFMQTTGDGIDIYTYRKD